MSRFSGKQHKGAMREYKADQKAEYQRNQAVYRKRLEFLQTGALDDPTERLLAAIFGLDVYMGMGEKVLVESGDYGTVDSETGDITYLGGTMHAGIDF